MAKISYIKTGARGVELKGSGFAPNSTGKLVIIGGQDIITTPAVSDNSGGFSISVGLANDEPAGEYYFVVSIAGKSDVTRRFIVK